MSITVHRKTSIIIEAEIKSYTPYGDYAYADPANGVSITIKAIDGTVVVTAQAMTKSATGKYYYQWQTTDSHALTAYIAEVTADDTTFDGFKKETIIFLQ